MTETKTILIVDSCKSDRYLLQDWLKEELDQNY
jgi:CheY-like chemotaxis protein